MISNGLYVQQDGLFGQQLHVAVDESRVRDLLVGVDLVQADEARRLVGHRLTDAAEHARAAQARVKVEVFLREVRRHVDHV